MPKCRHPLTLRGVMITHLYVLRTTISTAYPAAAAQRAKVINTHQQAQIHI